MLDFAFISLPSRTLLHLALGLAWLPACEGKDGVLTEVVDSSDTGGTSGTGDTEATEATEATGDTAATSSTSMTTGDPAGEDSAIAFLRSEKPAPPNGEPAPGDPNDLLITIADYAVPCADPFVLPECNESGAWDLNFVLNVDEQKPGSYAPADLDAELWTQSPINSPCEFNGPWPMEGTIEVLSITDESIVVRVTAIENYANGEYTVSRCAG